MLPKQSDPPVLWPAILIALLTALSSALQVSADPVKADHVGGELIQPHPDRLILVEPGPVVPSVLYADGSVLELETHTVWRPMCGSDTANVTIDDLRAGVLAAHEAFDGTRETWTLSDGGPRAALNIVWNISGGLPGGAEAALEATAQYIEGLFGDSVTVTINISMYNFGNPNVIGWTSSSYAGPPSWSTARAGLIDGMDFDDTLHDSLPTGSTIPVRYNAGSSTVTNETRCYFTRANYNATIGSQSGSAATMAFNTGFSFDYDPSNGVPGSQMCFRSVVAHEIGHALGFTSAVDFRSNDIEALDIFRFQRTDGSGDYNPDTLAEFQTTARTVDYNNLNDDANSDLISAEYRMSDGSPYQASHFREQFSNIGIMDPAFSYGETFYPNYYRQSDLNMFDAIGWDYPPPPAVLSPTPEPGGPACQSDADCLNAGQAYAGSVCVANTCYIPKNRYLSIDPTVNTAKVAYQVTVTQASKKVCSTTLYQQCELNGDCPGGETCVYKYDQSIVGTRWWLEDPVCVDNNGEQCPADSAGPHPAPCTVPDEMTIAGCSAVDGNGNEWMFGWYSALGQKNGAAPPTRTWTETPLHIGDCIIAPVITYEVAASEDGGQSFSAALEIMTIHQPDRDWGDLTGGAIGDGPPTRWSPPNGITNATDSQGMIAAFEQWATGYAPVCWADYTMDQKVDMADVQQQVLAIEQAPGTETYPVIASTTAPVDCR